MILRLGNLKGQLLVQPGLYSVGLTGRFWNDTEKLQSPHTFLVQNTKDYREFAPMQVMSITGGKI
jgi:hypothetical protein